MRTEAAAVGVMQWLALKAEEGAEGPRRWEVPRSRETQGKDSFLEPRRNQPCRPPDFIPVRPISDFQPEL